MRGFGFMGRQELWRFVCGDWRSEGLSLWTNKSLPRLFLVQTDHIKYWLALKANNGVSSGFPVGGHICGFPVDYAGI